MRDRDLARELRSWLHEDRHEVADRVLDEVLDRLPTTPQRGRLWHVGRLALSGTAMRIGLAAVVVVLAAFLGLRLLPGANVGNPSPTATATPTPQATPSPLPDSAFPAKGELAAGRISMTRWGVPFSFTAPASGWTSEGAFWLDRDRGTGPDGAAMLFWNRPPVNVYADPCNRAVLDPPAGESAAELATAMSNVPGTDLVSGPTNVTVGGYPAQRLAIAIRDDIPCVPRTFNLWYTVGPGSACSGSGECERFATGRGSVITVWIVDVNGVRIVIEGETYAGAGPDPGQEIQQLVDSIRFG